MQYAPLEPLPLEPASAGRQRSVPQSDPRLAETAALLPAHLELRRIIGEGGSSVVFEAFHARLKVLVAVKVLSVRGELAKQAYTRMTREAELYALLDDPRIPRVYDVNELSNGTPYVVMEMVPGRSLEELLREQHVMEVPLALTITCEVLAALMSVHERGVLHRDVKPANVILNFPEDGSCQVRLVDFGIAKAATYGTGQEAVTQRGTLVGTPQYMPPERLTGQAADETSDTYAVGIMLYEMLAGHVPFGGPNLGAVMASVLRDVAQPLLGRCPTVTPELEQLVMRSISRVPAERFATAREMWAAVDALREHPEETSGAHLVERDVGLLQSGALQLNDDDIAGDLRAAQRGKRGYGALLLGLCGLLLMGTVGWFYAEYHANTVRAPATDSVQQRPQTAVRTAQKASPPMLLPQVKPKSEPATPAAPAEARVEAALEQDVVPHDAHPSSRHETRRDRALRRSRREALEARAVDREAEQQAQIEAAPAPVQPAAEERVAPDYAKLLPTNPY